MRSTVFSVRGGSVLHPPVCKAGACAVRLFGGAPCAVRALCEKLAVFHPCWLAACHGSQGPEFCTPQPLLVHHEFDHACFCRWVVFRDVPGINTVIICAVRAQCPACARAV